jgi:glycosyltransferase involved in cell wall biosynthesis
MAEATARLLTDDVLWRRLRQNGWERVMACLSGERFGDEIETFLEEVLSGGQHGTIETHNS